MPLPYQAITIGRLGCSLQPFISSTRTLYCTFTSSSSSSSRVDAPRRQRIIRNSPSGVLCAVCATASLFLPARLMTTPRSPQLPYMILWRERERERERERRAHRRKAKKPDVANLAGKHYVVLHCHDTIEGGKS